MGIVETLRVEAGLVVLDYDYAAHERTPYDLSFDRMVALGKRGLSSAATPWRAVAARPAATVQDAPARGRRAPRVRGRGDPSTASRWAPSPVRRRARRFGPLGLAILDTPGRATASAVDVALGAATVPATVAPLAIYDPEKRRPRA